MKSKIQLIGQRFNRLSVVRIAGKDSNRHIVYECLCDCGNTKIVRGTALLNGAVQSCGCLGSESSSRNALKAGAANKTHGLSRTLTWMSWSMMMQRCTNPKRPGYKDYGGRGIKPCAFIRKSPASVIAVIGERPSADLQLDRRDNELGYYCGQCPECLENIWPMNLRWSDRKTQCRNKRNNVRIYRVGLNLTRQEWAEKLCQTIGWVRYHIG